MPDHKLLPIADAHPAIRKVFSDATARAADTAPYTGDEYGLFAVQSDNNTLWWLSNASTPTWTQLAPGTKTVGWFDVTDYGAIGDNTSASTNDSAFDTASAAAEANGGGIIWVPPGVYRKTTSWKIEDTNGIQVWGVPFQSRINWVPTSGAEAAAIVLGAAGQTRSYMGIYGMSVIATAAQANQIIGIDIIDCTRSWIRDVVVDIVNDSNDSIGMRTQGRDSMEVSGCHLLADQPLYVDVNPNRTSGSSIMLDHCTFTDMNYITKSGSTAPCVTIDPFVAMQECSWRGFQAMVGGGFKWNQDATVSIVSSGLELDGIRTEQMRDASAYSIDIRMSDTGRLWNLLHTRSRLDSTNPSAYLSQVAHVVELSILHQGVGATPPTVTGGLLEQHSQIGCSSVYTIV